MRQILQIIEEITIYKEMEGTSGNKSYRAILDNLKLMLNALDEAKTPISVNDILAYIQLIPIKKTLFSATLGQTILQRNKSSKLEKSHLDHVKQGILIKQASLDNNAPQIAAIKLPEATKLSEQQIESLIRIYDAIKETQLAWMYAYQKDENNKLILEGIDAWEQPVDINSSQSAFGDFERDILIEDKHYKRSEDPDPKNHKLIRSRIQDLVEKTNYSSEEKEFLNKWLATNGGDNNSQYIDFYINQSMSEDTQPGKEKNIIDIVSAKPTRANWFIKNGAIYFDYNIDIFSVKQNNQALFKSETGDDMILPHDAAMETMSKLNNVQPLMHIDSGFKLTVSKTKNGELQVSRTLDHFVLTSFSNKLINPSQNSPAMKYTS